MDSVKNRLDKLIRERILLLDGATGVLLQQFALSEEHYRGDIFKEHPYSLKGNHDILPLTFPQIIREVHKRYLEAGADIIETCSFGANKFIQQDYHTENFIYEMNFASAKIAKELAQEYGTATKERFVAGSIGPTNKSISIPENNPFSRDLLFDDFVEAYTEQIRGLIDGGIDILLIETVFDPILCKAALIAANTLFEKYNIDLPILVSMTIDKHGRLLNGQSLEAFYYAVADVPNIFGIGLNCSMGAAQMDVHIRLLSETSRFPLIIYPNAGFPDEHGHYTETPAEMGKILESYAQAGLINIVGGCCGTTPEHIEVISKHTFGTTPRKFEKVQTKLHLSGLEAMCFEFDKNFAKIGERTNIAGSKLFRDTINERDYVNALKIASLQIENGADVIDINVDHELDNGATIIRELLLGILSEFNIAKVPVMLDSSHDDTLFEGLKYLSGKGVVNSISLKDGVDVFIKKAKMIRNYGAAVLLMAFDEDGQATTSEKKVAILDRAYNILTCEVKFNPLDIIFDPNVLSIGTGIEEHNEYALEYLKAVKMLKDRYPNNVICGGISNISYAFRGNNYLREAINSVFIFHAVENGLDSGIVNPGKLLNQGEINPSLRLAIDNVLFNKSEDALNVLLHLVDEVSAKNNEHVDITQNIGELSAEDRLIRGIIQGSSENIEECVRLLLDQGIAPLDIVERPIMNAMQEVGEKFATGKMFLPQVVKSSKVLKGVFDYIRPYFNSESQLNYTKGPIILATVKGDVHDIGKNIINVVLECNGYKVIDLGIMVSADKIIETAIKHKAVVIALSGLISPSLDEMVSVARAMENSGLQIPLVIGGATTSKIHTALKISTAYSGDVIYTSDASDCISVFNKIFSRDINAKIEYLTSVKDEYKALRNKHNKTSKSKEIVLYEEALHSAEKSSSVMTVSKGLLEREVLNDIPINVLYPLIDSNLILKQWDISTKDFEASKKQSVNNLDFFENDLDELYKDVISNKLLSAYSIYKLFPVNSENDDIIIYDDEKQNVIGKLSCLRQQLKKKHNSTYYSLADFVCDKSAGYDTIAGFVTTVQINHDEIAEEKANDSYYMLMLEIFANAIAEAAAEYVHVKVSDSILPNNLNIQLGIRPAIGYPILPNHGDKRLLFDLLEVEKYIPAKLTDNFMIDPKAAVGGFIFPKKDAKYFPLTKIGDDQLALYAHRRGYTFKEAKLILVKY